jgi:hypothetical protein
MGDGVERMPKVVSGSRAFCEWRGVLHSVQDDPLFHAEADRKRKWISAIAIGRLEGER